MKVSYVKFMKREELISMFKDMHRFEISTEDGRHLLIDERSDIFKPKYENFNGVEITYRAPIFKLNKFDYVDVLVLGEGYVRYSMDHISVKSNGKILEEVYGFERED